MTKISRSRSSEEKAERQGGVPLRAHAPLSFGDSLNFREVQKIAFATDDLIHISPHLGRAKKYLIFTVEGGQVSAQEERFKPVHEHGKQPEHEQQGRHFHNDMVQVIADCQVVIARGMGKPALESVEAAGLQSVLTELSTIAEALQAYLEGHLEHRPNRVH